MDTAILAEEEGYRPALEGEPRLLAETLYQPISADEPCGSLLEDYEFTPMELACKTKPARYSGDKEIEPAVPPNYPGARDIAVGLLSKTRDLRLLARLGEIEANVNGPVGLYAALHLLHHYVSEHWSEVHPATGEELLSRRERALSPIRDQKKIGRAFEKWTVFEGVGLAGPITLRQLLIAAGARRPLSSEQPFEVSWLNDLVLESNAAKPVLWARYGLLAAADVTAELSAQIKAHEPSARQFSGLEEVLREQAQSLKAFCDPIETATEETQPVDALSEAEDAPEQAAVSAPVPQQGALATRDEANTLLDDVITYYAKEARSSPIPLVLLKVREKLDVSFSEWRTILAGSGTDEVMLEIESVDASQLDTFRENAGSVINDRRSVAQALDQLAAYYERTEPTNPASLIFKKTKSLVETSFLDTLRELAPKGEGVVALRLGQAQ